MGEINGRVAVNSGPVIKSRTGVNHGKALPHFAPKNAVRLKSSIHREPHDRGETRGVYTTAPAQDLRDLFHDSPPDRVFGHDDRVRPRSMLGWLLGGRATPEERRTAGSKCATRASALRQCVGANSEETCDRLAQDLDLCKVRIARIGTRRCVGSCFVPGGHRTGAVHRRCYVARADRHLGSRRLGTAILYFQKRPSAISSPIPPTHPTHHFPHLHSTGKSRVPRRRRRVLPLRAPRHQPHRQRGRYPGLLETAAEDARLLAT